MRISTLAYTCGAALFLLCCQALQADEPDAKALEAVYAAEIRPLVTRYCHECHSGNLTEADVDLGSFPGWADVRKRPQVWQKVGEMLASGQMPPKDAAQPNEAERARLQQWVRGYLTLEAKARAGDPGRVILRRLSNAEYTYTLRDLTGVETLDPAREFPVDGAAGEGFTNTGSGLVMSPALVSKYLEAAKEVANHAVLLPDGFRFSSHTTRRDWTDETLKQIREFYGGLSDARAGDKVNLQGIVFDTNGGGRLPLEKYLVATIADREALAKGDGAVAAVARDRALNAKYLGLLWQALTASDPSPLFDPLRARWRAAKPADAAATSASLTADIAAWQKGLWKFNTVGHIGKVGGPKNWQEAVNPLAAKQQFRFKIPAAPRGEDTVVTLAASDAGDGNEHDFVVWQQPRLVAAGRPDLMLRDVRRIGRELAARREQIIASTAQCLNAAADFAAVTGKADPAEFARKHGVSPDSLHAWIDYLDIGIRPPVELTGHFTAKLAKVGEYDFIRGWGTANTPMLLANSSEKAVRIPGNMKPHGVAVHPSATLRAVVGWRSPVSATIRVEASVTHAHPECGNGVEWWLETRHGVKRRRLAAGTAQGSHEVKIAPPEPIAVQAGDVVSLLIGPRGGNHSCDLTAVEMKLTGTGENGRVWNLSEDVSPNVLAGNPHADRFGNEGVWNFYTEPNKDAAEMVPPIPAGSLLAKWQAAPSIAEKETLAAELQKLLTSAPPEQRDLPDAVLARQLTSVDGPLLRGVLAGLLANQPPAAAPGNTPETEPPTKPDGDAAEFGLPPEAFGKHPDGTAIDAASLCVRAPSAIEIRLPASLASGCELVATGVLDARTAAEGSVQLRIDAGKTSQPAGLTPSTVSVNAANRVWTDGTPAVSYASPIVVNDGSAARKRFEAQFDGFRRLFPVALCYTKIVPVDEVVTLTLFYREDEHLADLMLDEAQQTQLNRMWDELHFVSRDALTLVDAFAQLMEFATQDADPKVFEPLRGPINERAAALRQRLIATEPKQLDALVDFAARAYRRPLGDAEKRELRELYARLRAQELPHEEAFRLTLARMLVSPAFLYRVEKPGDGAGQAPVSDWELASRLSYFLWSSQPDAELREIAAAGRLRDPDTLLTQTRRMLRDAKVRRLATEFACHWLHVDDFDHLDEKSERHFPTFIGLRGAMYEESIRFFTDLFQNNGAVTDILAADYMFLNEDLAKHYGIPGVTGPEWRRVNGVKQYARGGILAQATTLAKQSGASRTSPILRGNWISEVLLGDRLPRPPKGVPPLPDEEAASATLTVRQLVEKHTSDAKCAVCHRRIDPLGFSLEEFDAIGRHREKESGDRPLETRVTTIDGAQFSGFEGLRNYLLTAKRDEFLRQFCRKLLGYALGRSVQLSDEPLLAEMQAELKTKDGRIDAVVEAIVRSRQFRDIRGLKTAYDE